MNSITARRCQGKEDRVGATGEWKRDYRTNREDQLFMIVSLVVLILFKQTLGHRHKSEGCCGKVGAQRDCDLRP